MSAESMVIVCEYETGNLFRVFWDGRAALIESESDLRDVEEILALEPRGWQTEEFLRGEQFERLAYVPCSHCERSGVEIGPGFVTEDDSGLHVECADPEHVRYRPLRGGKRSRWRYHGARFVAEIQVPCCACGGSGLDYRWTGQKLSRAEVLELAGALVLPTQTVCDPEDARGVS